jgi:phage terminase large subunit-like protein
LEDRVASSVAEKPNTQNWWGDGPPPHERWPGVTIRVDDAGGRYRFDSALADRACSWFPRYCSHAKGAFAGQHFDLLDYQRDLILRPLFGWVREDGSRRFRKAYIEIPKKNGKTQMIAGLALYMLLADNEPGAEVYVAAADREQARILFAAAKAMVEANPALAKRLIVFQNHIERKDDKTAFFKVLSAEAATKHGPNIHCLIIDEFHAQPDRDLFETLTRGVIARRQPLILLITTAGDDDESICYEEYDYARRVLSGTIQDEQHLPVIFEAPKDADWQSPEVWRQVNPGIDVTIQESALASFALEAANEPRKRNDFLRYHLNRWTNQATAWITTEWWDACDAPIPPDDVLRLLPVAAGLDLAQKIDLASLVLKFRERLSSSQSIEVIAGDDPSGAPVKKTIDLNYRLFALPFFWIPENTMRLHEKEDGLPYSEWAKLGLVFPTEGDVIDYTRIYHDITTKILPRFPRLKQGGIGYDPAFATDIATQLRDRAGLKVEEILQNYKYMSEPAYIFEALIKGKRIAHGGHRVLRNHVETVTVKTDDAGRIRPVRPRKRGKHIDGVVASLMGIRMLANVPDVRRSKVGALVV